MCHSPPLDSFNFTLLHNWFKIERIKYMCPLPIDDDDVIHMISSPGYFQLFVLQATKSWGKPGTRLEDSGSEFI